MSYLYVTEYGARIYLEANCVKVAERETECRSIPVETLECIRILNGVQITTQCLVECMKRGIPISYYSASGSYYGRTEAAHGVCAARQRKQAKLYNTKFALELGREILRAKVKNQEVLLRRYARDKQKDLSEEIKMMKIFYGKIPKSASYTQMMGYEGGAAKYYFQELAKVIDARFAFSGRSRRPPRDAFNAMLSFGYSILLNEICGVLESKGLNTCFGFIHRDKEGHPTLASDLMEEWRAVLVDAVALSLVNGHEIYPEHFYQEKDTSGYYLTKEGLRIFINKLEKKRRTKMKYLSYTDAPVSFRRAMEMQAGRLVKAIEQEDAGLYLPVHIR